jgi:hypothetical protein
LITDDANLSDGFLCKLFEVQRDPDVMFEGIRFGKVPVLKRLLLFLGRGLAGGSEVLKLGSLDVREGSFGFDNISISCIINKKRQYFLYGALGFPSQEKVRLPILNNKVTL